MVNHRHRIGDRDTGTDKYVHCTSTWVHDGVVTQKCLNRRHIVSGVTRIPFNLEISHCKFCEVEKRNNGFLFAKHDSI
jgi:hypothetical protein